MVDLYLVSASANFSPVMTLHILSSISVGGMVEFRVHINRSVLVYVAPLVVHWSATYTAHHIHRSVSRISAPECVHKIGSAVEKVVSNKMFSFAFILEKKYFGLESASPSVLCSEGSPIL